MRIAETASTPGPAPAWTAGKSIRAHRIAPIDPLSIVCCADDVLASRVLASLPCARRLDHPSGLLDAVARDQVDIVIVDPTVSDVDSTNTLIQIRRDFPSVLVVLFTRLQVAAVRQLIRLAAHGIDEVVLLHVDDTHTRFVELTDRRRFDPVSTRVLDALAENLDRLPSSIRAAIVSMFRGPRLVRTTGELAEISGVTKRTLYRHLSKADIHSPRRLVAAGRVIRAAVMLRDPGRSVREIVRRLDYSREERFAEHLMDVTGMRTKELRAFDDLEQLARIVAGRVRLIDGAA